MSKKQDAALGYLIVIGLIVGAVVKFFEKVGYLVPIVGLVGTVALFYIYKATQKKKRREFLMQKYNDGEIVNLLMSRSFWQGQSAEQLIESLGEPVEVDNKMLKTKKKEIWKYNHQGGNRFGLRVTLENDEVVGWDQKA